MKQAARLIYADSEQCADMLYAVGLFIPDPFLWAEVGRQRYVVVSALEYGRVAAAVDKNTRVFSLAETKRLFHCRKLDPAAQIAGLSRFCGVREWTVPQDFPFGIARRLSRRRIRIRPEYDTFFPQREIKSAAEIERIREGVQLAEAGLRVGLDILRRSRIKGDRVVWNGKTLTAERLRGEIDAEISRLGGLAAHTIVAPGPQGADPHNTGTGPIRPHQPIVLDIFPRVAATGYFGDLTRTVVKGKAPAVVRRAYRAVKDARDRAIAKVKSRVDGGTVHRLAADTLQRHGFETDKAADPPYGFFHGTGHGLGLEIHEAPRLSAKGLRLRAGHVVTVEPGLYYPEWGGVRLEDVVVVRARGCDNLTTVPTTLEIS